MRNRIVALLAIAIVAACASAQRPAATSGEHRVVLNGVTHWYRVAGDANATPEPVVFLHGGPGQGSVHFAQLAGPHLEDELRMVYFDQRASGRSDPAADGVYTMDVLVADLDALRDSLGVDRMALIGQSFGGTLALDYAAAHPERVSAIVFVAGLWDVARQCTWRNRTLAQRAPAEFARLGQPEDSTDCLEFEAFESGDDYAAYSNAIMFPDSTVRVRMEAVERQHGYENRGTLGGGLFRSGLGSYAFRRFDRLTMPVLVISGAHDGAARSEGLRELAERLPDATFVEYERSGHFPYLDEPERFARDVADFLADGR